jgi:hypothetical protein
MAYLREDKENLEVSYPLNMIWEAIPKAIRQLSWKIEETDEAMHHFKIKTAGGFVAYPSKIKIVLYLIDEKTTRMSIIAETPVTTITSVFDYGRTKERVDQFIATLNKLLSS